MDVAQGGLRSWPGLGPSAHVDTFCRDSLPPPDQWPELLFDLPELRYPAAAQLRRGPARRDVADSAPTGRCLRRRRAVELDLRRAARAGRPIAHVLVDELGLVPGNRVLLRGPNEPVAGGLLARGAQGRRRRGGDDADAARRRAARPSPSIARPAARAVRRPTSPTTCAGRDPRPARSSRYGDDDLDARAARAPRAVPGRSQTAADDVALLAFTSGTTGRPKATMHFHRDVLAIADTFSRARAAGRPRTTSFTRHPAAGVHLRAGRRWWSSRCGPARRSLLLERADPGRARRRDRRARRHRAVHRADRVPGDARGRAGRPRCAGCAAACRPASRCPRRSGTPSTRRPGCGSSTGSARPRCCTSSSPRRTTTSGPGRPAAPVPGYRGRGARRRPAGRCRTATPGRLAVRGPTGCRYLADPRQQAYVRHGWNLTGDTYVRDADGYFWYLARSDDMIISAGYNIAGPEVENALLEPPRRRRVRRGRRRRTSARGARGRRLRRAPRRRGRRRGDGRRAAGARASARSRRTSTRGWSSSSPSCRTPPPASCSASGCASVARRRLSGAHRGHRRRAGRAVLRRAGRGSSTRRTRSPSGSATPPDDTFGFGVVFSDETLGGIEHADPVVYAAMRARVRPLGRHRHPCRPDRRPDRDHLRRARLRRDEPAPAAADPAASAAASSASRLHFRTEAPDPDELAGTHDLVVAADGVNSRDPREVRRRASARPSTTRRCRYMWLGTDLVFDAFTLRRPARPRTG